MKSSTQESNLDLVKKAKVIIGIDSSKYKHDLRFFDSDGKEIDKHMIIEQSAQGFAQLSLKLATWDKDKTLIGVESTGVYDKPLVDHFLNQGYTLARVNTMHVARAKGMVGFQHTKTDRTDAATIAFLLRSGTFSLIVREAEEYTTLKHLVQAYTKQIKIQTCLKNQLCTLLDECLPESNVFSETCSKSLIALLQCYGLQGVRSSAHKRAKSNLLCKISRGRINQEKADQIIASFSSSVGLSQGLAGKDAQLESILATLQTLSTNICSLQHRITNVLGSLKESPFLLSIRGFGSIITAHILAQTGCFDKYTHAGQIIKLAGLSLTERSSGQKRGNLRISRVGNKQLRSALYLAAVSAVGREGCVRDYHFNRKQRNQKPGMVNIVAVMKKLARTMFSIVKQESLYDEKIARATL